MSVAKLEKKRQEIEIKLSPVVESISVESPVEILLSQILVELRRLNANFAARHGKRGK